MVWLVGKFRLFCFIHIQILYKSSSYNQDIGRIARSFVIITQYSLERSKSVLISLRVVFHHKIWYCAFSILKICCIAVLFYDVENFQKPNYFKFWKNFIIRFEIILLAFGYNLLNFHLWWSNVNFIFLHMDRTIDNVWLLCNIN